MKPILTSSLRWYYQSMSRERLVFAIIDLRSRQSNFGEIHRARALGVARATLWRRYVFA